MYVYMCIQVIIMIVSLGVGHKVLYSVGVHVYSSDHYDCVSVSTPTLYNTLCPTHRDIIIMIT